MAGTLKTNADGKIEVFDNHSGHYMPGMDKAYIEQQVQPGYAELQVIAETALRDFGLPKPLDDAWEPFEPTEWSTG